MTMRNRYLLAGTAWAVLLGPVVAAAVFGFALGASWLWLFGDDPWPAATRWILPLVGLGAGAAAVAACLAGAAAIGRRRGRDPSIDPRAERRRLMVLTGLPLVLLALLAGRLWWEAEASSRAMALATQREADFAALVGARHRVVGLAVERGGGQGFRGDVRLAGQREGSYRLDWRVGGTSFGAPLAGGERLLDLARGDAEVAVGFAPDDLARSYRERVLNGAGGVLVDEPFRLEVTLTPVLDEAERQHLPPGERHRLETGESPLRSRMTVEFPVRFLIRADGGIEH